MGEGLVGAVRRGYGGVVRGAGRGDLVADLMSSPLSPYREVGLPHKFTMKAEHFTVKRVKPFPKRERSVPVVWGHCWKQVRKPGELGAYSWTVACMYCHQPRWMVDAKKCKAKK